MKMSIMTEMRRKQRPPPNLSRTVEPLEKFMKKDSYPAFKKLIEKLSEKAS